jgi:hypothetical protein
MSDDEGPDDYADYDDTGDGGDDIDQAASVADGEETELEGDGDQEVDEDEGGLGSPVGSDGEEEGEDDNDDEKEAGDGEDTIVESALVGAAMKAVPQRARVDPILKVSNKPRAIRVVAPEDRVTDSRLHRAEAAQIIAIRAEHIAKFATHFAETTGLRDPVDIAFAELYERRCPSILRRNVGTGPGGEQIVEDWDVRQMTLPPLTLPPALIGKFGPGSIAANLKPAAKTK